MKIKKREKGYPGSIIINLYSIPKKEKLNIWADMLKIPKSGRGPLYYNRSLSL